MLKPTPRLTPPRPVEAEFLPLLDLVAPLRDTPDLMLSALDALLEYNLDVTINPNPAPYAPIPAHELRLVRL